MYRIVKRDQNFDNGMDILFLVSFLFITILPLSHANLHNLEKRSTDGHIAPEDCEKKIMESESKDAECYRIGKDKKCDAHCSKLGEQKCGGTNGKSYNYQCKNPQVGSKKACCCAYKCESKDETKRRLEKHFSKMKQDSRGLCSPFTDSEEKFKSELKNICTNNDKVHIARKFCLEEQKGEKYFCLKVGECKGKKTKTCFGCIAHECVMKGEDEGAHIVIPEDYEKERLEKQDFDKSAVGNVDDMKIVKKEKRCKMIECKHEGCEKMCRKKCKRLGNKMCGGAALSYGTGVEGKSNQGKHECCCQPVCNIKGDENSSIFANNANSKKDRNNKYTIEDGRKRSLRYSNDNKVLEEDESTLDDDTLSSEEDSAMLTDTKALLRNSFSSVMKKNQRLCTSFEKKLSTVFRTLDEICENNNQISIARRFCLEEMQGGDYNCFKKPKCQETKTGQKICMGCIVHECFIEASHEGNDEGHRKIKKFFVPGDYPKRKDSKEDSNIPFSGSKDLQITNRNNRNKVKPENDASTDTLQERGRAIDDSYDEKEHDSRQYSQEKSNERVQLSTTESKEDLSTRSKSQNDEFESEVSKSYIQDDDLGSYNRNSRSSTGETREIRLNPSKVTNKNRKGEKVGKQGEDVKSEEDANNQDYTLDFYKSYGLDDNTNSIYDY